MSYEIELENIGPVKEFSCELEPGLNVIRGNHGSGKTTILRTVELAVSGRTDVTPTKTDGAKNGKAVVAGKTLKISRTVRKDGELDIEGLGDLDLMTLHSPNYKDAVTRDKYRIKTLAMLAGAECEIESFYPLLGNKDEFEKRIDVDEVKSNDIVEMAGKVKRAIDKLALADEKYLEQLKAEFKAKKDSIADIDLSAESDEAVLSQCLEDAIHHNSEVQQQAKTAKSVLEDAEKAKERLAEMNANSSLESMRTAIQSAKHSVENQNNKIERLRSELNAEEYKLAKMESTVEGWNVEIKNAEKLESLCSSWRESIAKAESIENPSEEEVQAAKDALDAARKSQENGVAVRAALKAKKEADDYKKTIKSTRSSSEKLREAAKKTSEVVSDAIGKLENCPLKVHYDEDGKPRMVTSTKRSELEPIDELSDGERWKLILPLAFKSGRMITLTQASFGELSEDTRSMIHNEALKSDCVVLAAQIDTGDLRCERFEVKDFALHA